MLCCVETLQRFSGCWRLESLCSEVSDYSETVQGHCSSWTEHRLSAAPHTLSCQNTSECVGNLRISLRCKVTQTFKDSVEWDALVSDAGFAETRSKWFCVFELIWDNTLTETGLGSGSGVHHFHRTIGIYWCQNMTPGEDPFSLDVWVYSECPHPLPHGSFLISHSGADRSRQDPVLSLSNSDSCSTSMRERDKHCYSQCSQCSQCPWCSAAGSCCTNHLLSQQHTCSHMHLSHVNTVVT